MKTEEEKIADAKEAEKKIEAALEQKGVKHFWAKLIASVIIAGLAIAASFFATSCTVTFTKLPDGTVQAHGGVELPQRVQTVTK